MNTKILSLLFLVSIGLFFTSCKKEVKKADPIQYTIEPKTTTINWTAYKTTDKIPVKGVFNTVNIAKTTTTTNPFEAVNQIEFSIPVNSINSKNEGRDAKLINAFFGSMTDTQNIKGKIDLGDNGKGNVAITMNGITANLPITYTISGQLIEMDATMNLDNWKTKLAIDALNKVCNEKHKGKDGISKTWSEVNIHIVSYLKAK